MRKITNIIEKKCQNCDELFVAKTTNGRPVGHGTVVWKKRMYCDKSCAMKTNRGTKPTVLGKRWKVENRNRPLGIHPKSEFKKGLTPWNKGTKGIMKPAWNKGAKGLMLDPWNKGKKLPQFSKENNPNWKGGVTSQDRMERVKFRKQIQKQVFERDDYTCQLCNERGVNLQVDHIQSWADYVELRFDINNCRTLCASCHYYITFGKPMPPKIRAWGHNFLKGGN